MDYSNLSSNIEIFARNVVEGFITGKHKVHIMDFQLNLLNIGYITLEKVLDILIGNYSHVLISCLIKGLKKKQT